MRPSFRIITIMIMVTALCIPVISAQTDAATELRIVNVEYHEDDPIVGEPYFSLMLNLPVKYGVIVVSCDGMDPVLTDAVPNAVNIGAYTGGPIDMTKEYQITLKDTNLNDASYVYNRQFVYHKVDFVNYDGKRLLTGMVRDGDMPIYIGDTPVRPSDDVYNYIFSGWSPEISISKDDAVYTAKYTESPITSDKELISISVSGAMISYLAGERFSTEGMVVTASYSDGTSDKVTGYGISPDRPLDVSDTTVTVSYSENGITKDAHIGIIVSGSGGTDSNDDTVALIMVAVIILMVIVLAAILVKRKMS